MMKPPFPALVEWWPEAQPVSASAKNTSLMSTSPG
jgi:hypothetical protein